MAEWDCAESVPCLFAKNHSDESQCANSVKLGRTTSRNSISKVPELPVTAASAYFLQHMMVNSSGSIFSPWGKEKMVSRRFSHLR